MWGWVQPVVATASCEHFSWGLIVQGFSGSFVELPGDGAELGLAEGRQVDAVRQVLAQQAVGVLVGAALPRAVRIAEVDLDVGCEGEAAVVGKLLAPVPGQRPADVSGQLARLPDQRRDDGRGLLVRDLGQDHVARLALDQRHDMAAARSRDKIAFPVPGHGAVLDAGRSFADRDRVLDLAEPVTLQAGVARAADRALRPQMLEQFLLQHAARLDIEALVDRLV